MITNENVENDSLEVIAERIVKLSEDADGPLIEAAKLLRGVKERIEAGEVENTNWTEWAEANLKLRQSRLLELMRIATAEDPEAELDRLRDLNRERQRRHRKKSKSVDAAAAPASAETSSSKPQKTLERVSAEAPLRNGANDNVSGDPGDDREKLIVWVSSASPSALSEVLNFIQARGLSLPSPEAA